LLQFPIPASSDPNNPSRQWFNIILDPWLTGPQSDLASWFSRQWHAIAPALRSVEEVEALCHKVEVISAEHSSGPASTFGPTSSSESGSATPSPPTPTGDSIVDAIIISHEFTDHCHQETLLQFSPSTPVIATTKAADLVRSWNHFTNVIETPSFGGEGTDWKSTKTPGLPNWFGVGRVVNGKDAFYYHSAISIFFDLDPISSTSSSSSPSSAQCVIYSPHGISPESLSPIIQADPAVQTLAILHGLHDVSIDWGQQLNLGAHNGLKAQKVLNAKYWIGTHDEVKTGGGVVSWFLRRKVLSVADAVKQAEDAEGNKMMRDGEYVELSNGETLLLK
jgi:hypothetical protein